MSESKKILEKKLDSKYNLIIIYDPEGPLSVRLENSKNEYIGQIFVSFDTIEEITERMTNGEYKLSKDDLNSVKAKVLDGYQKPKTESVLSKLRSLDDLVNDELSQFVYDNDD